MIEQLFAENYGCLTKIETPKLGMLHAFIGPNDSGKSTLLRAVRLLTYCASNIVDPDVVENVFGVSASPRRCWIAAHTPGGDYQIDLVGGQLHEAAAAIVGDGMRHQMMPRLWGTGPQASRGIKDNLQSARLLRLDPDALRKRSSLIPDGGAVTFIDDRGHGLPGVYDHIVNRGDEAFATIRKRVIELFPAVKSVRLRAVTKSEKELEIELRDGTRVPAAHMSEGLLYFLAFSALPYLAPTSIVLMEEPENGLHPARIAEVVRTIREFSQTGTQVLLATHRPLVVNELAGDEVTVVTRDDSGTKLKLMKDTPNFEERSKVYALGELWVSYANGTDEAPLMSATAKQ